MQLLGGQPGPMAENAARVAAIGAPGIDLNFGCPAKTVNRHDEAQLCSNNLRAFLTSPLRFVVRPPLACPWTAKVRLVLDHKEFTREIAQAVEEAASGSIVVHARTKRKCTLRRPTGNTLHLCAKAARFRFWQW